MFVISDDEQSLLEELQVGAEAPVDVVQQDLPRADIDGRRKRTAVGITNGEARTSGVIRIGNAAEEIRIARLDERVHRQSVVLHVFLEGLAQQFVAVIMHVAEQPAIENILAEDRKRRVVIVNLPVQRVTEWGSSLP